MAAEGGLPPEPADGLDVILVERDGRPHLRVVGEVDSYTAPLLRRHLEDVVGRGDRRIVVDLVETTLIDSTGLGAVVSTAARLRELGGELVVVCPPGFLQEVLSITGVDQLVTVVPAADERPGG